MIVPVVTAGRDRTVLLWLLLSGMSQEAGLALWPPSSLSKAALPWGRVWMRVTRQVKPPSIGPPAQLCPFLHRRKPPACRQLFLTGGRGNNVPAPPASSHCHHPQLPNCPGRRRAGGFVFGCLAKVGHRWDNDFYKQHFDERRGEGTLCKMHKGCINTLMPAAGTN